MHAEKLAQAVFEKAKEVEDNDASELLRVFARVIRGKTVAYAFGAPGDWGYGTPIGDALTEPPNTLL